MRNFNTIILYFLPYSGGNFLGSCLLLDNECMLHNSTLIELDYTGKLEYLNNQLDLALEYRHWNDFNLGNGQLGIDFDKFLNSNLPGGYAKNIVPVYPKKTCASIHNYVELMVCKTLYPHNQVLLFTNAENIITSRNKISYKYQYNTKLYSYWQTIRDSQWPDTPPHTLDEFELLPERIRTELIECFNSEILRYLNYTKEFLTEWNSQPADFKIDVNYMYSSFENFFNVYTDVCKYLNLEIANKDDLSLLFNKWKKTITQLAEQA